jgi:hypothetical protein
MVIANPPGVYKYKPSRSFAEWAANEAPTAPEPLSAASRRTLSDRAFAERLAIEKQYVGSLYVPTAGQRECAELVKEAIDEVEWAIPGAQNSLYVLGPPGAGKSTAVMHAAAEYHRDRLTMLELDGEPDPTWRADGFISDLVPVVFVTWRSAAQNKAIVSQIAQYLGYGTGNNTATATTDQMTTWAKRHGIGLVVGDDCRNIADSGKAAESIHNLLKNLNTELGALHTAWVYIGIPDKNGMGNLFANDQLDQRLKPYWLNDFDFDMDAAEDTDANKEWATYLRDWERALAPLLPDMPVGHLYSQLGRRLWNRTQGSVGGLATLLKGATRATLKDRSSHTRLTLTRDRLSAVVLPERFTGHTF